MTRALNNESINYKLIVKNYNKYNYLKIYNTIANQVNSL